MFCVNDPRFFPNLKGPSGAESYENLAKKVQGIIVETGHEVQQGSEYVKRIELCDEMHFDEKSAETVAEM